MQMNGHVTYIHAYIHTYILYIQMNGHVKMRHFGMIVCAQIVSLLVYIHKHIHTYFAHGLK
jgi:hypothetical protein